MMEIIDTHSHLFTEEFSADLPEVIARAKEAGVTRVYMPNIDVSSVEDMLRVSRAYEGYCFPMIGLHPTSVSGGYRAELADLKRMLDTPEHPFVAIGEVGIDLYWDTRFKEEQIDAFRQQVEWALAYDLPVIIHCRSAVDELVTVLEDYRDSSLTGIFHSFGGTVKEAKRLLSFKGFMLGINGVLTFKKSLLPEVLATCVPMNRLVLETDAPYLAPVPYRGKRNESSYIKQTLKSLASVYGKEISYMARITSNNAKKVFERGKK